MLAGPVGNGRGQAGQAEARQIVLHKNPVPQQRNLGPRRKTCGIRPKTLLTEGSLGPMCSFDKQRRELRNHGGIVVAAIMQIGPRVGPVAGRDPVDIGRKHRKRRMRGKPVQTGQWPLQRDRPEQRFKVQGHSTGLP